MTKEQQDEIVARFVAGEQIDCIVRDGEYLPGVHIKKMQRPSEEVLRAKLRSLLAMEKKAREFAAGDPCVRPTTCDHHFCTEVLCAREILAAGDEL